MKECPFPTQAQVCMTNCIRPADALNPLVSAENLCFPALSENARRETIGGVLQASFLIEEAANLKKPTLLGGAESILSVEKLALPQRYKAGTYEAYLPLYDARIEDRYPTEEELLFSFNGMTTVLRECNTLLQMTDNQISSYTGGKSGNMTRKYVSGVAGEGLVLYLSLYNALNKGGTVLYPSSLREDNVTVIGQRSPYVTSTHDAHTHSPDNTSERKIFSIKGVKNITSKRGEKARRINILHLGSNVYRELTRKDGYELKGLLELEELLDLVLDAEDSHTENTLNRIFRSRLGNALEDIIEQTEPIPSTYQTQEAN